MPHAMYEFCTKAIWTGHNELKRGKTVICQDNALFASKAMFFEKVRAEQLQRNQLSENFFQKTLI